LLWIPKMLVNKEFRAWVIPHITDPVIRAFVVRDQDKRDWAELSQSLP